MSHAETQQAPALAIIEKAYRGSVEKQHFDAFYVVLELHRQLGGLEVLLRGPATSYAAATPRDDEGIVIGNRVVHTLTDHRAGIRRLLDLGVPVWCEKPDATASPFEPHPVITGVRLIAPNTLAARWSSYRMVLFM